MPRPLAGIGGAVVAKLQLAGADRGAGRAAPMRHIAQGNLDIVEVAPRRAGAGGDQHRALDVLARQADPGEFVIILAGRRLADGDEHFMLGLGAHQDPHDVGDDGQGPVQPLDFGEDARGLHSNPLGTHWGELDFTRLRPNRRGGRDF